MSTRSEVDQQIGLLSSSAPAICHKAAGRLVEIGASEAYFALHHRKILETNPHTIELLCNFIVRLEVQLSQLPVNATIPGLLGSIRLVLRDDQSDAAARAAALCTLAFVERLGTGVTPSSSDTITLPQAIPELIGVLQDPRKEWRRRAEGTLILHGSAAVQPLCEAYLGAAASQRRRIAGVLADIDDIAALPTLWAAWREGLENDTSVSRKVTILRMGAQLAENPQKIPIQELLSVLSESKEHLPALAKLIAQALEHWAEKSPTPELRRALPLLKGNWLVPAPSAFDKARRAIEAATAAWASLPIAADIPGTVLDSLPVPAESGSDNLPDNLPIPNEASR